MQLFHNGLRRRAHDSVFTLTLLFASVIGSSGLCAGVAENVASETLLQQNNSIDHSISLYFDGKPLSDAVTLLSQRSGISIELADELKNQSVRKHIKASTWNQAIKQLLDGYSFLGIIDGDGVYRRVIVTGVAGDGTDPIMTAQLSSNDSGLRVVSDKIEDRPVSLWQLSDGSKHSVTREEGISSEPIVLLPDAFDKVVLGQPLQLEIPQEEVPLYGIVSDMHTELNGKVTVWSGPLDGSHETASFTITKGSITTYVTVATGGSIYEISVDNDTGEGSVFNEEDLTRGKQGDDVVVPASQP